MATLSYSGLTKTSVTLTSSGAGTPSNNRYWTFTITPGGFSDVVGPNKSTSASCSFSGLSPGTTYTATCRYGPASNKTQYSGGSCTFTTDSPQTLPSGTAKLSEVSKTTTSLKIKASGMTSYSSFTRTFYWFLNGSHVKTTTGVAGTTTSDIYEFTGLSPGTTYTVRFEYKRTGAEYDTYYVSEDFTTYYEDSADVFVSKVTNNSVTIDINNITPTPYSKYVRCVVNGITKSTLITASTTTQTCSFTFDSLSPNTEYKIDAGIRVINDDVSTRTWRDNSKSFTTISLNYTLSLTGTSTIGCEENSDGTFTIIPKVILTASISPAQSVDIDITYKLDSRSFTKTLTAGTTSLNGTFTTDIVQGTTYTCSIVDEFGKTAGPISITVITANYKILNITSSSTYNQISINATISPAQTYDIPFTYTLTYGTTTRSFNAVRPAGSTSLSPEFSSIPEATGCEFYIKDWIRDKTLGPYKRRTKNNFSWSTNVSSGALFNLKASDWNEFTSQLSTKCNYYSLAGTYTFDTANKGANFTAKMFNQAVEAINGLVDWNSGDCVTKMSKVSTGDSVMADDINQLAKCLNE